MTTIIKPGSEVDTEEQARNRHRIISEMAYFKAEARHFEPGRELDDWLAAETEYTQNQINHFLSQASEDGGLHVSGLQALCHDLGIDQPEGMDSEETLVRSIQKLAGHRPCFRTGLGATCSEDNCQWQSECSKLVAIWKR